MHHKFHVLANVALVLFNSISNDEAILLLLVIDEFVRLLKTHGDMSIFFKNHQFKIMITN